MHKTLRMVSYAVKVIKITDTYTYVYVYIDKYILIYGSQAYPCTLSVCLLPPYIILIAVVAFLALN